MTSSNAQNKFDYTDSYRTSELLYLGALICDLIEEIEQELNYGEMKYIVMDNFMRAALPLKEEWIKKFKVLTDGENNEGKK